ncbi:MULTISPECIES: MspA family porin [Mycobacteriaceae]|uniref:MspA family porin n=1 Tax=Mycobacteriaceae TaxID=1762 RepID=UPI0008018418|nr:MULTISPECIES: MspA family porin [Mycobacteriaceae]MCK0176464.1 MspA family porin [Mycolicibacterium sp. F2034L]OBB56716.1 MspA protein [Mycobacterium sp. 852013-51886_SCH5428379]
MLRRSTLVVVLCAALCAVDPAVGSAQPDAEPVAADVPAPDGVPPPPPDGAVLSTPPAILETPGGWTLTLSADKETQAAIPPLTTALSSREYVVGGTFSGDLTGPDSGEPPTGILEVGYEIGCGIDMSTSNGVALTGTAGLNSSLGLFGTDFVSPLPDGIVPGIGGNIGGGVTVGLKPGLINVVPVTEKEFTGTKPWVMVSNFRVKIDGCVGQSFIRSYALLTHETEMSEAVLAWYGTTKMI